MNSKTMPIIVLTVALASLSMVGISTNMLYVMADQHQNGYKNQGQCMKGEKEDGIDKQTYKSSCKAIDFHNDDDDQEQSSGTNSGSDDVSSGNNEDNQSCQVCSGN